MLRRAQSRRSQHPAGRQRASDQSFKKDGDISEDDAFKAQDQVQKITDEFVQKIDDGLQGQRERDP
jgi:ribosome recycling factor